MACGTREPVALQRLSVCFLQHASPHSGGYVAGLVTFGLVVVVVIFPLQGCLSSRCCSSFPSAFYRQFADKGLLASNLHMYRSFSPAVVKLRCTLQTARVRLILLFMTKGELPGCRRAALLMQCSDFSGFCLSPS